MGSLNRVYLLGRLGADPKLRYTPSNVATCELSLATSKQWKSKDGTRQEKTEWHTCVLWREQAENAAKLLTKGREVLIEGELTTRSWEKDGQKHFKTEVSVTNFVLVGKREDGGAAPPAAKGGGSNDDFGDLGF